MRDAENRQVAGCIGHDQVRLPMTVPNSAESCTNRCRSDAAKTCVAAANVETAAGKIGQDFVAGFSPLRVRWSVGIPGHVLVCKNPRPQPGKFRGE